MVVTALAVLVAVVLYRGSRPDSVNRWCRDAVHAGDHLSSLDMPGQPHLVEVKNGVWSYDDGVTITFVGGYVFEKRCG